MTKKLLMILKITMLISMLFFASCNSSSSSSDTATPSGDGTTITDANANCTFVRDENKEILEGGALNIFSKKRDGVCSVKDNVATWETAVFFEGANFEYKYTVILDQTTGIYKYSTGNTQSFVSFSGEVTVSADGKRWEWKSSSFDSNATLEITGDISGNDTSGDTTATAEGKVLSKDLGFGRNTYDGVTSMTCTLEVEEAGKSPITYNGACDKDKMETKITFEDPNVSVDLVAADAQYPAGFIGKYSKAEDVVRDNPTATTKVSRENNVWEGKITTADGGTDLLKLTITTEDIVVAAPAGSKPCQLVNKIILYHKAGNYTLDGYCVLTYDTAGTTVTKLDFTSSLANPAVIISLPIGKSDEISSDNPDNRSQFKDTYVIGDYLYEAINSLTTIDFNDNKNNTFTAEFIYFDNNLYEFDIVLTE